METVEKIEEMRKDPEMKLMAKLLGFKLDDLVDAIKKDYLENKESDKEDAQPESNETCLAPTSKEFLLSKADLESFINKYLALENMFKKLNYAFGIDLNSNTNSIYTKYNELVWDLMRAIFGEENCEDILDYVFDNSNFDSVESLYNELT